MIKEIVLNGKKVKYIYTYKNVKNVNLRIKADGCVCVSSSKRVPQEFIENFLVSRANLILKALEDCEKFKAVPRVQHFDETEICDVIVRMCEKAYHYYAKKGIEYPEIRFRKMTSRWGSCHPQKGILTFNKNLMYAPPEAVEYVVLHEFTHFLVPNHSEKFYSELEKVCPEWKAQKKALKEINLR